MNWIDEARRKVSFCVIGEVVVGAVTLDERAPFFRAGVYAPFHAMCKLPGVRINESRHPDEAQAREAVEVAVLTWLEAAGLEPPEGERR